MDLVSPKRHLESGETRVSIQPLFERTDLAQKKKKKLWNQYQTRKMVESRRPGREPFPDAAQPGSVEPDLTESVCPVPRGPWCLLYGST